MYDKKFFAQMRKSGMGIGVSKAKLSQAMLEILLQLPEGTKNLKETITRHMGLLGQMSATRDLNAAWNQTKKDAAKRYLDKFILGSRGTLLWNDGSVTAMDRKISAANFKKLNALAEAEGCNVDTLVSKMIRHYKKSHASNGQAA